MKRFAYFLILLLLSAQLDDYWAVAPVLPSATLAAADDDEYLPSQRRSQEDSGVSKKAEFVGLQPRHPDFPLLRSELPFEWNLSGPFTPPPLDLFMSLQL
jgi:hypothetical protein